MYSAHKVVDLLLARADANRSDSRRNGQMVNLPGKGEVIVAGDLHHHRRNFERIVKYAHLEEHPERFVVLQELLHGGMLGPQGEDTSLELLVEALGWANRFPGQVVFLLSNHDLAQVEKVAVMKDGYNLTQRFINYCTGRYGSEAENVLRALRDYVYSQPLAVITATGLLLAHSLPGGEDLKNFDRTVLSRALTEADYLRQGPVYQLIWGRRQTAEVLGALSKAWWAEVFICGHQLQDTGYGLVEPNLMIVDSSHQQGVILHLDLGQSYTLQDLTRRVVPLAALP